MPKKSTNMKNDIYYLETFHRRVYFAIRDGLVQCDGTPTKVPEDKLILFLAGGAQIDEVVEVGRFIPSSQ